jgi:hypothetical protein
MNHHVKHQAQLRMIKITYNVMDQLSFSQRRKERSEGARYAECLYSESSIKMMR